MPLKQHTSNRGAWSLLCGFDRRGGGRDILRLIGEGIAYVQREHYGIIAPASKLKWKV